MTRSLYGGTDERLAADAAVAGPAIHHREPVDGGSAIGSIRSFTRRKMVRPGMEWPAGRKVVAAMMGIGPQVDGSSDAGTS